MNTLTSFPVLLLHCACNYVVVEQLLLYSSPTAATRLVLNHGLWLGRLEVRPGWWLEVRSDTRCLATARLCEDVGLCWVSFCGQISLRGCRYQFIRDIK